MVAVLPHEQGRQNVKKLTESPLSFRRLLSLGSWLPFFVSECHTLYVKKLKYLFLIYQPGIQRTSLSFEIKLPSIENFRYRWTLRSSSGKDIFLGLLKCQLNHCRVEK